MPASASFRVRFIRADYQANESYVGERGEISFDTTNWRMRVHDGATVGGHEYLNANDLPGVVGNRTVSANNPSGGVDGDIWYTTV